MIIRRLILTCSTPGYDLAAYATRSKDTKIATLSFSAFVLISHWRSARGRNQGSTGILKGSMNFEFLKTYMKPFLFFFANSCDFSRFFTWFFDCVIFKTLTFLILSGKFLNVVLLLGISNIHTDVWVSARQKSLSVEHYLNTKITPLQPFPPRPNIGRDLGVGDQSSVQAKVV